VEPEPVPLGTETFCLSGTRTGTTMHSGFRSRAEIKWNDKNKKVKQSIKEIITFWETMLLLTLKRQDCVQQFLKNCA
jgi:hypothetical protein